jgi:hypothetical protein
VKALTVQQPWAWCIVAGGKDVENRTTAWKYRGPLAIHAGQRVSQRGTESPLYQSAAVDASMFDDPTGAQHEALGAIIGVVELVDIHDALPDFEDPTQSACCDSPWGEQQYVEHGGRTRRQLVHLVLEDPRPVDPIPCVGRLGLWTPEPDVLEQLAEVTDR